MINPSSHPGADTNSAAEIANAAALISDQRERPQVDHARAGTICNLAEGHAFCPDTNTPPIPILMAFGSGRLHQCRAEGTWDLARAIAEEPTALIRSYRKVRLKDNFREWDDLTFQFGTHTFLCADERRIVGYAATAAEAERQVEEFTRKYGTSPKTSGGSFQLIYVGERQIGTVTVQLEATTILSDEHLGIYYGDAFPTWHREFAYALQDTGSCLCIFEGAPGTGKTSYLRHLMGALQETHRFYFIPPSTMRVLSDPKFMEFWAAERRAYPERKLAVILEDSDAALMTRASDNREQVSAILNLSDGMLGDFLRLQVICTMNCTAAEIDAALLRPGRLLRHRVFPRLNPEEARRLAEVLGKTLPRTSDYSLAEVFAGSQPHETLHSQIGFAA